MTADFRCSTCDATFRYSDLPTMRETWESMDRHERDHPGHQVYTETAAGR